MEVVGGRWWKQIQVIINAGETPAAQVFNQPCLTLIVTVGIILALLKQPSLEREVYCLLTPALCSVTSTYSAMQAKTL